MFSPALAWRQRALSLNRAFPQFRDLLVAVIDADTPEQADQTADGLARALAADTARIATVRRPDTSPYLESVGLMFLDEKALGELMDRTIDAQPFLGQLAADPSARGLFAALTLLAMGVERGQAELDPVAPALEAFRRTLTEAADGHAKPLSWERLLAGGLSEQAGQYRFVLAQPKLDYGALQPGGVATQAVRDAAAGLPWVKAGQARVRITGSVALADEEFATVARGVVAGLIGSLILVTIWLVLAVRSWRLIGPILLTLGLGLMLTVGFAAAAVGTLNLVSVAFAILFVGIAVDFAIQFCVRYRDMRRRAGSPEAALSATAARVGPANPGRRRRHGLRVPGLRADRFQRCRRAGADRRRRHADRVCLHAGLPAGGADRISPARRGARGRLCLGRCTGGAAAARAHPGARGIRGDRLAGSGAAAPAELRFRPVAHQGSEHRGDADARGSDELAAHQPVQHRHPDARPVEIEHGNRFLPG